MAWQLFYISISLGFAYEFEKIESKQIHNIEIDRLF